VLVGLRDKLIADALGRLLTNAGFYVSGCLCEPGALIEHAARSLPDAVVVGADMLGSDGELPLLDALRARGHQPAASATVIGSVQAALRGPDGTWVGAADPRREGSVVYVDAPAPQARAGHEPGPSGQGLPGPR
jgi:hypothetical protein